MLPAVGQGAIGVEIRLRDNEMAALVSLIDDAPSAMTVEAERAYLGRLEGSCRTPIAGLAMLDDGAVDISGELLTPDGRLALRGHRRGALADRVRLAIDLADELRGRAGPDFFDG